ncbi:hypothetical protein V2J09_000110 [Rumex salicifolius]
MVHRTNLIFLGLLFLIAKAAAECTCEAHDLESDPKSVTLPYKVWSIFAILMASAVGVGVPLIGRKVPALSPESNLFLMIKAFAAGVILATGFIHILPEAFESLSSPCLKNPVWEKFPFTGFAAMLAALATLMVESAAAGYYRRMHLKAAAGGGDEEIAPPQKPGHVQLHGHAAGHDHARPDLGKLELMRNRVTTQMFEMGILVHSIIIGVSMGTSKSLGTIKPLLAALCFHQFFEGLGLGGCIAQAKFKIQTMVTMAVFFCLTTPLGVAIGIVVEESYDENSPKSLIVQGIFDSIAGGILIYMALVGLLAADFMSPRMQSSPMLQLGANVFVLLGAGCMSVLAIWA